MKKIYELLYGAGEIKDFSNHNVRNMTVAREYFIPSCLSDAHVLEAFDNEAAALKALNALKCTIEKKDGLYYGDLYAIQTVTLDDDGNETDAPALDLAACAF